MEEKRFFHSVRLEKDKCKACTNCLKRCPTEAIRVRGGRAHIIDERCIDCGECIRVCSNHAKVAVTDPLSIINNYEYKITYVDAVDNQTHTVNATKNSNGTLTIPSVTYNIKNADGTTKRVTTTAVTVKGATYDGEKFQR